jgi:predicted metal-dependent hydrolase
MNEIKIDKIIRSKRKTIALVVSADATLVVRAPMIATLEYIKNLVFKERFWINEKKKQVLKNGGPAKNKEFMNGEGFLYLGEIYKLKIENCEAVKLSDYLYFPQKYLNNAPVKMIGWYKQKALEKITERVHRYSQITGWKFSSISVTRAEKRLGSCGPGGSVNFSWKLIMAPVDMIDYVVVHELAHITEKNHSVSFWNKVKTVLPDYKSRQRWLKDNRINLKI